MTQINEVPIGKFCRFAKNVVYVCKNDFKASYTLIPAVNGGFIPRDKAFNHKVYVYKRIKKEWIEHIRYFIDWMLENKRIDNLTYIENLSILNNYLKPVIVSEE